MDIGITIRTMRKHRGLTLKDLSNKTGVSISQIGKIEQGIHTPPMETVIKLAKGLSVNENELLEKTGYNIEGKESDTTFYDLDNIIKYKTFIKYDLTCQICGKKAPSTEIVIDFVIPLSFGGAINNENTIVLCKSCKEGRRQTISIEGLENDFLYKRKKNATI